jgi:hypothetical protein
MSQPSLHDEPLQTSVFDRDEALDNYEREQYQRGIRKARNTLFAAGALMFVVDAILLFARRETLQPAAVYVAIAIDLVVLSVFIGLGLYTKRKPYAAILAGLLIFCLIQVAAIALEPANIYKGLLMKIAVITTLVSGLRKAKALQDMDRFTV